MMKALVLGLGISGKSAVSFLQKRGYEVVGVDDRSAPIEIFDLSGFSLFVPSPGIPRSHPFYVEAKRLGIPIKGEAQLALESCKNPCIGVTGTNGKTTVVKLIEHGLNACGKKAKALGNVGEPLTGYVASEDEILVVELSSFQLETLHCPVFDVGLVLNIEEDHLDRYDSFAEYAETKMHLQNLVKRGGVFSSEFLNEDPNLEAALFVAEYFGIDRSAFIDAYLSFAKPPHRLEFVDKIDGVSYFNDSKATNVASVLHAIRSIEGKIVLLSGGRDKGLDFTLLQGVANRLNCVIAFGEAREKIANALNNVVKVVLVPTMEEAVEAAKKLANEKEVVLFSPGCSSFDAFANFSKRGEVFKEILLKENS